MHMRPQPHESKPVPVGDQSTALTLVGQSLGRHPSPECVTLANHHMERTPARDLTIECARRCILLVIIRDWHGASTGIRRLVFYVWHRVASAIELEMFEEHKAIF
jgi:hypothetical protein